MKTTLLLPIALAGLLGCCSGSRADSPRAPRPTLLPVKSSVVVKEVNGLVEYAYDGTGWRVLEAGKVLRAGATLRAAAASNAILRVDPEGGFLRVSPATMLHITARAPVDEIRPSPLVASK